jgi:hypothetical protein
LRSIESLLYGIEARDLLVAAVPAVLSAVAPAVWLPANRATRVNPVEALDTSERFSFVSARSRLGGSLLLSYKRLF